MGKTSKKNIRKRLFLVGCPRSGTTLLQCLLAAQKDTASFPETFFFPHLISKRRLQRMIGIASSEAVGWFDSYFKKIHRSDLLDFVPQRTWRVQPYAEKFVALLDTITLEQGKDVWVEKTPAHLLYIKYIEKLVPNVCFIHIIRKGEDVIASLYEVAENYPEIWGGKRSIEECVNRWSRDIYISKKFLGRRNHAFVKYESIIENTRYALEQLCNFINITFQDNMLSEYHKVSKKVVLDTEPWKNSTAKTIENTKNRKFGTIFTEEEKQRIIKQISKIDINRIFKKN